MRLLCFRLLETVLGYINTVAQSMEKNVDKLTVKFWRALLSKAYDMLDKVGSPFSPPAMFGCCFYVIVELFNKVLLYTIHLAIASLNAAQIFLGKESLDD